MRVAQDYERLGEFERALQIFQSLYAKDPDNPALYQGLKRNLLQLKRYAELKAIIEKSVQRRPNSLLQVDLGTVLLRLGQEKEALALWHQLLQSAPNDQNLYRTVANAMIENRLYEEASAVYKSARRGSGDESLFALDLANLYTALGKYKDATEEYLNFVGRNPQQWSYVEARLASYAEDSTAVDQMVTALEERIQRNPRNALWHRLLAGVYLRTRNYPSAFEEYKILELLPGLGVEPRDSAVEGAELFSFAEQALEEGAHPHAEEAYRHLITKYPNSPYAIRAQLGLARSYERQGAHSKALAAYDELMTRYPKSPWAPEALFQIGEIRFNALFDLDGARAAYGAVMERFPSSPRRFDAMLRIGDALIAQGRTEKAEEWYQKPLEDPALRDQNIKDEASYRLAELYFLMGDFAKALEPLHQILKGPSAASGLESKLANDALELAMFIEENRGQYEEPLRHYAQCLQWEKQRQLEKAVSGLQRLIEEHRDAPLVDDALLKLGELETQLGRYQQAIAVYQKLIQDYPESIHRDGAQKRIGEVYEIGLKDSKKAVEAYELVLVNYPQSLSVEEVRKRIRSLEGPTAKKGSKPALP